MTRDLKSEFQKKTGTFENIQTKILKSSSVVLNAIVQNIWNSEIIEK